MGFGRISKLWHSVAIDATSGQRCELEVEEVVERDFGLDGPRDGHLQHDFDGRVEVHCGFLSADRNQE